MVRALRRSGDLVDVEKCWKFPYSCYQRRRYSREGAFRSFSKGGCPEWERQGSSGLLLNVLYQIFIEIFVDIVVVRFGPTKPYSTANDWLAHNNYELGRWIFGIMLLVMTNDITSVPISRLNFVIEPRGCSTIWSSNGHFIHRMDGVCFLTIICGVE